MKTYIGTKIVGAEPAFRLDGKRVQAIDRSMPIDAAVEEGYRVIYPDGYESWSPKDVFERPIVRWMACPSVRQSKRSRMG